ncbi:MAG: UDP-glucuronosyltransferase [Firmicutes bacterium]|nr:UDP-glucuronosyltransferase [Bacillota bacterium]
MKCNKITVLCSGVAMGVYIPAILLDYQLRTKGIPTEVVVLENLIADEKKKKILENKKAFHQSFRVALTGQKINKDLGSSFDPKALEEMNDRWVKENRSDFIVFSGFWIPILKEYINREIQKDINIDIVHMDAGISTSWKKYKSEIEHYNHIWLFNLESKKLDYELSVANQEPIPFKERMDRYVIHGGGWGMGTYQSKIPQLEAKNFSLDIVAYDPAEVIHSKKSNRYFMVDPDWSPWLKNKEERHEFPPFGEVKDGQKPVFRNRPEYHELFDVIRLSKGIISKPGGATLVDSLSSATPLIMLDPFGDYEQKNADLWEWLGFGISYDKWKESGYSESILEKMHQNILNSKSTCNNYVNEVLKRFEYKI